MNASASKRNNLAEEMVTQKYDRVLRQRRQAHKHRGLKEIIESDQSREAEGCSGHEDSKSVPTTRPAPLPIPDSMSTSRSIPLLICSVGNPAPYLTTLHSAGHLVLNRLAESLGYPPFRKDRSFGNGLVSTSAHPSERNWILWQSTSLMNVSGSGVRAAFSTWSKSLPDGQGKLVIVHDELEKPLGAVSLNVRQGASAKGHNGLKSILSSLGGNEFVRIGVGIGRPESRESRDVAAYVLKKMTSAERVKIEGSVDEVVAKLMQLERG
jgi:PTH1 family peptidyl-tRNA hydrolase